MVAFVKHNVFVQDLARKLHNLHTDTIKVALSTSDPAATDVYTALANEVANGNGYTTGGPALANQSAVQTAGSLKFDADDPSWTGAGAGFTFRYATLYNSTAAAKNVVNHWDFGSAQTVNAGDVLALVFAGGGILTIA